MGKEYSIDIKKRTCIAPECRGSYVNILKSVLKLKNEPTDPDKYVWNMQCIFKKTPNIEAWAKELKTLFGHILIDKLGKEKAGEIAKIIVLKKKFPLRDGDDPATVAAIKDADQLKGCYFIGATSHFKQPHIVGAMGKIIDPATLNDDDIYSGAYYRVMLQFFYYNKGGSPGIGTSLEALMKTKDGENLGTGTSKIEASNAFSEYSEEAVNMFTETTEENSDTNEEGTFTFM